MWTRRIVTAAALLSAAAATVMLYPELAPRQGSTPRPPLQHAAAPTTAEPEPASEPGTGPPAPTEVAATSGENGASTISWVAPTGTVTDYEVQIVGQPQRIRSAGPDTSLRWTGLANGEPYRFRVRAVNDDGWGAWSQETDPVTPAAPAAG